MEDEHKSKEKQRISRQEEKVGWQVYIIFIYLLVHIYTITYSHENRVYFYFVCVDFMSFLNLYCKIKYIVN